jgi:6-phosphogluconolactonase
MLCVPAFVSSGFGESARSAQTLVYFGTYTGEKSKGIYVARLDPASGKLSAPELAAETVSPSFLAIHPNRKFLYAANEVGKFEGKNTGSISAFSIQPDGKLTLLNQVASAGAAPCHLVVDQTGQAVLVANYVGGNVASFPIHKDGRLGEAAASIKHEGSSVNPQRQKAPHAHSINLDPGNRFAAAADLGLDKILVYRFDARKATLTPNDPPHASVKPGAGPRHFAFHPAGRFAYVINELDCTITAFSFDGNRGELKEIQTVSTLPEGESVQRGYSTAEVQVHPSGKFLYGSNRGHNTIAVFTIDEQSGKLSQIEVRSTEGRTPRNFGIDPAGQFLLAANQQSDNVVVFRIDAASGRLVPTGQTIEVGTPVCVKFLLPQ